MIIITIIIIIILYSRDIQGRGSKHFSDYFKDGGDSQLLTSWTYIYYINHTDTLNTHATHTLRIS